MSNLIAVAYPDPETAEGVRSELVKATKEYLLTLDDAVVVVHEPDGKVKLRQAMTPPRRARPAERSGATSSASCSSLRWWAWPSVPHPARSAARWPTSASTTTSEDVGEKLTPGSAALIVLTRATPRTRCSNASRSTAARSSRAR